MFLSRTVLADSRCSGANRSCCTCKVSTSRPVARGRTAPNWCSIPSALRQLSDYRTDQRTVGCRLGCVRSNRYPPPSNRRNKCHLPVASGAIAFADHDNIGSKKELSLLKLIHSDFSLNPLQNPNPGEADGPILLLVPLFSGDTFYLLHINNVVYISSSVLENELPGDELTNHYFQSYHHLHSMSPRKRSFIGGAPVEGRMQHPKSNIIGTPTLVVGTDLHWSA